MRTTTETSRTPAERVSDLPRILHEMGEAVREALARHRRLGNPVAVWRDGRVQWIPPEEIPVEGTEPEVEGR
ncbi:MAG: hypothetical protein HY321_16320 [Armatimonadetes bacterium]|nr:hypothetical protein [Armatimonadota bacterium]